MSTENKLIHGYLTPSDDVDVRMQPVCRQEGAGGLLPSKRAGPAPSLTDNKEAANEDAGPTRLPALASPLSEAYGLHLIVVIRTL